VGIFKGSIAINDTKKRCPHDRVLHREKMGAKEANWDALRKNSFAILIYIIV
jgi:hypothetical protein